MEQIVADMNRAGYVKSIRGAQGGYILRYKPKEYRLDMILKLTEKNLVPNELERCDLFQNHLTEYLKKQTFIDKIYYVGDIEHPQYELSKKQTAGFGAMISFSLKNGEKIPEILKRFQVVTFAESLGGVESLITFPMVQTHGAIPEEMRERLGVNDKLLRLSVGIEDVNDLIEDFEYVFSILKMTE